MKLRLATKILRRAINTGVDPRPDTLRRAVATFPKGPRHHPRKYQSAGLIAAFLNSAIRSTRFGSISTPTGLLRRSSRTPETLQRLRASVHRRPLEQLGRKAQRSTRATYRAPRGAEQIESAGTCRQRKRGQVSRSGRFGAVGRLLKTWPGRDLPRSFRGSISSTLLPER